ncbi:regulatory protein RecX [Bifidobacterium samirii]|uniref:Regulatory protein RecX n=1 Tax=Bifidobacterium samirii TaxID=2306974 RepID=A0A430FF06_9BIFI|nr:regulatory protein RecX [Bifidobacterium samirii]RSX51338.1 RecX-like protein [Bifidobacterium samirii]
MISAEDFLASVGVPAAPAAADGRSGIAYSAQPEDRVGDAGDSMPSPASPGFGAAAYARFGTVAGADGADADSDAADDVEPNRTGGSPRQVDASEADDLDSCREAALRLLDAAPRASGALRDRLLAKGYGEDVVEDVIDRLSRVDLIDDEAYARSAVRYCAGRLMGSRAAVAELVRKGVDRSTAGRVVREAAENGVFEEAVWELGRRYERKTRGMERAKRLNRFWAAGGRKGHDPAELRRVAAELFR